MWCLRRPFQSQPGHQTAALPFGQIQGSAMGPRDAFDDGKTQARPARPAARFREAGEGTLQAFGLVRRDPGTAVQDVDTRMVVALRRSDLHGLPGVPERVVDQVDDRPADAEAPDVPGARVRVSEQGY